MSIFMKRILCIAISMMMILTVSSCTSQNTTQSTEEGVLSVDTLIGNIGKTPDEVFETLNIDENNDVEKSERWPEAYELKNKQKISGEDFTLVLEFDVNNNTMYGFRYLKEYTTDNMEDGYNLVLKLNEEYNEQYGEPIYPLENSIASLPSYDELVADTKTPYYFETWKVNDKISITLRLDYAPDVGMLVSIEYKLDPLIGQQYPKVK